ncbi:MAG: adenosine deaminase family protein [Firmicutes bacterium]|nr:adenosine deaminase family protein [Bacillota bacterium]
MDKEQFFEIIRQIPKAEIHIHLENFLAGQGAKEASVSSLSDFVVLFRSVQDSVKVINDMSIAFKNIVRYMKKNGIVYAEVFFSPGRYVRESGWSYKELIKFFEKFSRDIKRRQGFEIKYIVDVSRSHGVEIASTVLDMVTQNKSEYVLGIGLGGDEIAGPARNFTELFKRAREYGLRTVAHAGEADGPHSIFDAVELLGAERIGHATSAGEDPKILELLIKRQIPIEVALTSNLVTGRYVKDIVTHPLKKYLEEGAFITLNTDDPTIFNTSLLQEYWNLYNKIGYDIRHLYFIIVNGFQASFLPERRKREYIKMVNKMWSRSVQLNPNLVAGGLQEMGIKFKGELI